ncbi:hypothetical protein N481_00540 [Pseudoalteromonas luteoviolacea S4047-1]|uniref:Uncharacterized protein n=1 Tax=Pseudoalteromonas luteoviolacea S4054 TaxID=1129367 RepID=A0A0F6A908_9GAMM|nr:hypothetical protein N479_18910 [Pseudoalteromonas luteoviolacea S4054]KZN78963.1 hypothetical protein N481_00540 [Pseudoalteromonas luteoviolacea S4047-1]
MYVLIVLLGCYFVLALLTHFVVLTHMCALYFEFALNFRQSALQQYTVNKKEPFGSF